MHHVLCPGNVDVHALGRTMSILWSSQSENGNRQVKLSEHVVYESHVDGGETIATLQHFRFADGKPGTLVKITEEVSNASGEGIFIRIQPSCHKTGKTLSRHSREIIMEQMNGMNNFQPEGKYPCTIKNSVRYSELHPARTDSCPHSVLILLTHTHVEASITSLVTTTIHPLFTST